MPTARRWSAAGAVTLAVAGGACTLTTSLDGFTGGASVDGGVDAHGDAAQLPEAASDVPIASCNALKRASPSTPDGLQTIDPDGDGPAPSFRAWCDMTQDEGGWMLVTAAMLGEETNVGATVTMGADARGGVTLRVFVNLAGCGQTAPTRHRIYVNDSPAWTKLRVSQTFAGSASCWHIWGGQQPAVELPLDPNLFPFDSSIDVIRDAIRMGGSNGDAFDGLPTRCDNARANFWQAANGFAPRSGTVILRRREVAAPSGLETGADCGASGPGTTSATWWDYHDIYVK